MNDNGFKIRISMTHIESGETVEFVDEFGWPGYVRGDTWEYDPVFIWSEGNFSCNCNRFLFFQRALGKSEAEIDEMDPVPGDFGSCGGYIEAGFSYRVNWIRNEETGKVIYEEAVAA